MDKIEQMAKDLYPDQKNPIGNERALMSVIDHIEVGKLVALGYTRAQAERSVGLKRLS